MVRIDSEFEALCPPLSDEEYALLKASILEEGCRDALIIWQDIVLDGHNRKRICEEAGLWYDTTEIELPDRDAAKAWMLRNQLGRRNLHPDAASLMRGRLYNMQKKANGVRGAQKLDQNDPASTAERLASDLGVSAPTIKRDGQFAEAVEALAPFVPDIQQRAMTGDLPSRKAVIEAARSRTGNLWTAAQERRARLAEADSDGQKIDPPELRNPALYSSDSVEWNTPPEILDLVVSVFGEIDLDPCSNSKEAPNVPAALHYTEGDDGLSQSWHGRIYMNPPYGRVLGDWIHKLVEEFECKHITEAIALVPSRTDTQWFRELKQYPRCFIWGRLKFGGCANCATFPSMAVYLGDNRARFVEVFSEIGDIYEMVTPE